ADFREGDRDGGQEVRRLGVGQFAGGTSTVEGLLAVANGVVGTGRQDPSQVVEGVGIVRLDSEDIVVVADDLGVLSPGFVSAGPVEVGIRVFGIEPDRRAVVRDRLVVLFPGFIDVGPVVVGVGPFRIEADGFAVVG